MNNKTLFSQDKKFLELWKLYTKGIKEILHMRYVPHHWYILSDYCLFDKNKPSPTATFTICPFTSPSDIGDYLSRKQFKDIKQLTKVPDEVLKTIRDDKFFFTISFVIEKNYLNFNDKDFLKIQENLKTYIKNNTSVPENQSTVKHLKKLVEYMNQKNFNKKLVKNFHLIGFIVSHLIEFLVIKNNAKSVYWVSDRGALNNLAEGAIFHYVNILQCSLLKGRANPVKISYALEDENNNFQFDGLIKYPDIITGTISSLNLKNKELDKNKHLEILANSLVGNPRFILIHLANDHTTTLYTLTPKISNNEIYRVNSPQPPPTPSN